MIKIESVRIEEFRGIRKLEIDLKGKNFAISGPNGSGKSGVIDAIEFGLTGNIGRLSGTGTSGLSLGDHGPHVDMTKFPDAALVELSVYLPALKKSATITRKISAHRKPKIEPDEPDIRQAFSEIAEHPEITLARRDILRFILVEPTKRSKEIQTLLRLDEIDKTRSALHSASRKLGQKLKQAETGVQTANDSLVRHLDIASLNASDLLGVVKTKRSILGLKALAKLSSETRLDEDLDAKSDEQAFNKPSALRDLEEMSNLLVDDEFGRTEVEEILQVVEKLEHDSDLLESVHRRSLLDRGVELVDGPACPLCDNEWPSEGDLLSHLKTKIKKSEAAEELIKKVRQNGAHLTQHAAKLREVLRATYGLAKALNFAELQSVIASWGKALNEFCANLQDVDKILVLKERLTADWRQPPEGFLDELKKLSNQVSGLPDQSARLEAHTFVSGAQSRLGDYRKAARQRDFDQSSSKLAAIAHAEYCTAMEAKLAELYEEVKEDFSKYYKAINGNDEEEFTAKLTPSDGKLGFDVNFYGRGLFPPGAFHSEGHQDGMGVCLYLALMKRLLGDGFLIALLDDVVMSVDVDHRRNFCQLLKSEFPDTQFIIATHDRVWAEQMKRAGLVTGKTSLAFHSWSVNTGPLVESNADIWEDISKSLDKNKVETAAHTLRRHLEFEFGQLAANIGARIAFRIDGNYDLGELLPSTVGQLGALYSRASEASQSWSDQDGSALVKKRKDALKEANKYKSEEEWAVNKAVHHNEWANFGKNDFTSVVEAFKRLLSCFQCENCEAYLEVTPRGQNANALRCQCSKVNLNLVKKK